MSRQNHLFLNTINQLLDLCTTLQVKGENLPNDSALTRQLNVSRSTIRKALEKMEEAGILRRDGPQKIILRSPQSSDYFKIEQQESSKEEIIEKHFVDLILSGKILPGDHFSELELARQTQCNTVSVREFLIKFSRFGLIDKAPRSQWRMKEFDEDFVDQLYEVRHMFEMHALSRFMRLPSEHPAWNSLETLLQQHRELKTDIERNYSAFSQLDQRFHLLLWESHQNQFIRQFYDIISFVFHYHYQWDKSDEKERNSVAVDEHIDIISHMLMKDLTKATLSMERHLNTAKTSLKRSTHLIHEKSS
uniref:GntR family transcriptional regulator n=1 Tax=Marinobacterium profundum TaxID=1714300 RepID=UPI00083471ED|nr:GntR family transcriptional regulator [Marinobacterium profundum]